MALNPNIETLAATCSLHASAGYTNLQVRRVPGGIQIDPHVTGACMVTLTLAESERLLALLNRWLP